MNDFYSRLSDRLDNIKNLIENTLTNIKAYLKQAKELNIDYEMTNIFINRRNKLKVLLRYFKFVSGDMDDKTADEYLKEVLGNNIASVKGGLGDIRNLADLTIIQHNIENAERDIQDVEKIILWINRDKSMYPTEQEKSELPDFFKLEVEHERTPLQQVDKQVKETIDIEVDTNFMKINKIEEYLNKKIPDNFIIYGNKIYINEHRFNKVKSFLQTFEAKKYIKIL